FRVPYANRRHLQGFCLGIHIPFERGKQGLLWTCTRHFLRAGHLHAHAVAFASREVTFLPHPCTATRTLHPVRRSRRGFCATLRTLIVGTNFDFHVREFGLLVVAPHIAVNDVARVSEVRTEKEQHFVDRAIHLRRLVLALDDSQSFNCSFRCHGVLETWIGVLRLDHVLGQFPAH